MVRTKYDLKTGLTVHQAKAVRILMMLGAHHTEVTPRTFAKEMWPGSLSWERASTIDLHRTAFGQGIILKAKQFLANMEKLGLVSRVIKLGFGDKDDEIFYILTDEGMYYGEM